MRILFFTPHQLWPTNSGARLRTFHLAASLAKHCPVTLFQILRPEEEVENSKSADSFEAVHRIRKARSYTPLKILRGLLGPVPLTVLNYSSVEIARTFSEVLSSRKFDAVQLESSHLYSYVDLIRSAPGRPRILLDWHNIESELMRRFASETQSLPKKLVASRTAGLLEKIELNLLRTCDAHTVVSEREKEDLLRRYPKAKIEVIPNGVDTQAFVSTETTPTGKTLLFVGSMDYHANIDAVKWFVRSVWPTLSARFPTLRFIVVGRSPGPEIRSLESDRIHITGTVPDVRSFYADADAVVVPLRVGGGTRLKILEAMAMGVPVISTTLGAEGINYTDGKDILLADSAGDMTEALTTVINDPALGHRVARQGRSLVSDQYDWDLLGARLFHLHEGLMASEL